MICVSFDECPKLRDFESLERPWAFKALEFLQNGTFKDIFYIVILAQDLGDKQEREDHGSAVNMFV